MGYNYNITWEIYYGRGKRINQSFARMRRTST